MAARLGGTALAALVSVSTINSRDVENGAKTESLLNDTLRGRDRAVLGRLELQSKSSESSVDAESVNSSTESEKVVDKVQKQASGFYFRPFRLGEPVPWAREVQPAATSAPTQVPVLVGVTSGEESDASSDSSISTPVLTAAALATAAAAASTRECDAALEALLSRPQLLHRVLSVESGIESVDSGSRTSDLDRLLLQPTSGINSEEHVRISNPLESAITSPAMAALFDTVREVVQDEELVRETQRLLVQRQSTEYTGTENEQKMNHYDPDSPLLQRWEQLRESYQCGICLDLLAAPKLADCTHSFCGMCVTAYAASLQNPSIFPSFVLSAGSGIPTTTNNLENVLESEDLPHSNHTNLTSATNDAASPCPEHVMACPSCREVISTVTFERTLDRDLAIKVDEFQNTMEWSEASEVDRSEIVFRQEEWHARRSKHHADELARKCSSKALSDRARSARARAAVHDDYRSYAGRESRFLDQYYGGPHIPHENPDDEESYSIACNYIIPLALAVLMLVLSSRDSRNR
jgi:hypothetical protein